MSTWPPLAGSARRTTLRLGCPHTIGVGTSRVFLQPLRWQRRLCCTCVGLPERSSAMTLGTCMSSLTRTGSNSWPSGCLRVLSSRWAPGTMRIVPSQLSLGRLIGEFSVPGRRGGACTAWRCISPTRHWSIASPRGGYSEECACMARHCCPRRCSPCSPSPARRRSGLPRARTCWRRCSAFSSSPRSTADHEQPASTARQYA